MKRKCCGDEVDDTEALVSSQTLCICSVVAGTVVGVHLVCVHDDFRRWVGLELRCFGRDEQFFSPVLLSAFRKK